MTATTKLKLPDDLKARIAAVAQRSGKSALALMSGALELQTELAERRTAFVADALLARPDSEGGEPLCKFLCAEVRDDEIDERPRLGGQQFLRREIE